MSPSVPGFKAMGARKVKKMLRKQLGYREVPNSGSGSHEWLESPGRPRLRWGYHDSRELSPIEIRRMLTTQVGLTLDEAKEVSRHG